MTKICLNCGKSFYCSSLDHKRGFAKYCARKCYAQSKKGYMPVNLAILHKRIRTKEMRQLISQHFKNQIPWNKGKTFPELTGENSPNWRGGITTIRKTHKYKLWRKAVLKMYCYTCIWCGATTNLEADHIKSFALYPDLRFKTSNGRILCHDCHIKTDNYRKSWLIK